MCQRGPGALLGAQGGRDYFPLSGADGPLPTRGYVSSSHGVTSSPRRAQ